MSRSGPSSTYAAMYHHVHHQPFQSHQLPSPPSRGGRSQMDVYRGLGADADRHQSSTTCMSMSSMYPRPHDIYGRMPELTASADRFPMPLHHSNIFGGGGGGGSFLDDGSLYMNTDGLTASDITKSSPPLTPSSSSRSAIMKHDVASCLSGYGPGYASSAAAAAAAAAAAGADLGCRPFHSPGAPFGESMLDQLQVVPGHPDPGSGAAAAAGHHHHQLQPMYPASVYASQRGYYHMPQSVHFGGAGGPAVGAGSAGGLHGSSTAADLHHAGAAGAALVGSAECDTRELEAFAEHFKQRRIKIGVTQADVGSALGKLKLPGVGSLSQSTICRFESLTLSHNNMVALKPVLQAWLEEAEAHARDARMRNDLFVGTGNGVDRKRKRTSIATPEKRSLEAYFAIQPRPSGEKIAQIAEKLDLKKNVVRVWFCNQRQKQKRMKFAAGALQGPH